MVAYVAVHVNVKSPEKFAEYGQAAGPTVAAHGGAFTHRGLVHEILAGSAVYNRFAVIEFPDVETARNWYSSPEYQALIPLRDAAADVLFTLAEPPS